MTAIQDVIDQRTRVDGQVGEVDAVHFLDHELPQLFTDRASVIASADGLDLRPMEIRVDDGRWVLHRDDGVYRVERLAEGADGPKLVLTIAARQLADVVTDQITPVGMMTAASLDLTGGGIGRFLDWWLVLRSAIDDVPVYTAGSVALPDDLGQSFTLDDDPADIREFLATAGFVHLRGVFTAEEMQRISDDMDAAVPSYRRDDGNSWWATVADGTDRLVRMQRFEERSAAGAELLEDLRFLRIAEIAGAGHTVDWATDNRLEALFKPIGVASGISDVPWHKDCSLGRHSYECCALTVGISVTGAGPTTGQLRVVAGSHRARIWPSLLDPTTLDLPDVALATETGDVTVHLSCTLHMAQEPTERERRVLYTGFRLPSEADAEARLANRRLLKASREGAPLNTSQTASTGGTR